MDNLAQPPSTPPASSPKRQGTFHHLTLVISVAFILATLFTAWTPGDSFPLFGGASPQSQSQPYLASYTTPTLIDGKTATPRARPLIGIVAGHWGNDSGAVCDDDGLREVDVNLKIATLVQRMLIERGMDVDLLKEFDDRLMDYQASALVSIHNDSCKYINDQATGFKVASTMASPRPERAARLTACLRNRYAQSTSLPLHSTSVTLDMTNYHAFGEINADTTAAIIETGFLNLDRQFLTEQTNQVAEGIANGILCYLYNENIAPSIQASTTPPPSPAASPIP